MERLLALITLMAWPVIPLFWIPLHCATGLFRRMGLLTYLLPLMTWLPAAVAIYSHRDSLLRFSIDVPPLVALIGTALLVAGSVLHLWTARLLGLRGITGVPEVSGPGDGRLVAVGIFSVIRHPTYLAHTMMFLGVFLMTGYLSVAAVAILDILTVNLLIIPLEERELLARFGGEYEAYRRRVPRILPRLGMKVRQHTGSVSGR